jgi:hypothetical protein
LEIKKAQVKTPVSPRPSIPLPGFLGEPYTDNFLPKTEKLLIETKIRRSGGKNAIDLPAGAPGL